MTFQEEVRAALADAIAEFPEMAVAVAYQGKSGTGLDSGNDNVSDMADVGQMGVKVAVMRISAAAIDEPPVGATLMLAGEPCTVMGVKSTAGALWTITYQRDRPVEGV